MARELHNMIEGQVHVHVHVHGYHVYKEIWCADVGEELSCVREVENYRSLWLRNIRWTQHKKEIISVFNVLKTRLELSAAITGSRRYSEDLPQGGGGARSTLHADTDRNSQRRQKG